MSYYCNNCKVILNYRPCYCPNCRQGYFVKISDFDYDKPGTK